METCEVENYNGARLKTAFRSSPIPHTQRTLPQKTMVQGPKDQLETKQDQALEQCAALLWDEVFDTIPSIVNTQHAAASQADWRISDRLVTEDDEVFDNCQLPQRPDTPIASSGHGHEVTFRSPVAEG